VERESLSNLKTIAKIPFHLLGGGIRILTSVVNLENSTIKRKDQAK